jgi:hypothetical protein
MLKYVIRLMKLTTKVPSIMIVWLKEVSLAPIRVFKSPGAYLINLARSIMSTYRPIGAGNGQQDVGRAIKYQAPRKKVYYISSAIKAPKLEASI